MDIHKPKPVHNLRDFLKEVGIIVLGVCIALAAEQAVEHLRWKNEVASARKRLAAEISINDVFMARRIAYQPCMARQLTEAGAIIEDLETGQRPRDFTSLHTGVEQNFEDSQWQSERASQVLTHFPDAELDLMARHYASLAGFRLWMDHEGFAWADLAVLRNPPSGLGASDFLRLRASLHIATRMNALTVAAAARMLRISRQLGIGYPPVDPERVRKFCTLSDIEFSAYLHSLNPN